MVSLSLIQRDTLFMTFACRVPLDKPSFPVFLRTGNTIAFHREVDMNYGRLAVHSALTLLIPLCARAGVLTVPSPYVTIQSAVNAASPGDTIIVGAGTYTENVLIDAKALVLIGDSVLQTAVIQSGASFEPVVHWKNVASSEALILGFTVQDGANAPGILCENSPVRIRKNVIRKNSWSGVRVTGTVTAVIAENVIVGNSAYGGGGISLDEGGAEVTGNIISGNTAELGGGIFSDNRIAMQKTMSASVIPAFVVRNNVLAGNFATLGGGGAYLYEGFPLTFIGNLFVDDTANSGGGIANSGRFDLRMYNNTFDRCVGGNIGGSAIWWAHGGNVGGVIRNNIITNCLSTFDVGGAIGGDPEVVGLVDVDYNDLWNNSPADYYRLTAGPNAVSADPLYCDAPNGYYALNSGSPCLGAGEGGQDIGAFGVGCSEAGPFVSPLRLPLEEPYHVVDHTPILEWHYVDPNVITQSAFELEVGTDAEWTIAELWQPGVLTGAENSIEYAGAALLDGQTYFARVRASNGTDWSSWVVSQFRMNTPPAPPALVSPPDGNDVVSFSPYLEADGGPDGEGDAQTFRFEVYADAALTALLRSRDFELSFDPPQFWQVSPPLLGDGTYWWRAMGSDGYEASAWSAASSFRVDATNDPPLPFALLDPADGAVIYTQSPLFDWEDAVDADPGDRVVSYTLTLALDSAFSFSTTTPGIPISQYQSPSLPLGDRYWWRVSARDEVGNVRIAGPWKFVIPTPGDIDGNLIYNLVDIVKLIDMVFRGVPLPAEILAVDVNGDCQVDIRDVVRLIDYILRGGPLPNTVCVPPPPPPSRICVPADYATIQTAVNAANPGDTVCVLPGTYFESVVVSGKSLVLLGDTISHGVIVEPPTAGAPALDLTDNSLGHSVVLGFVFRGADMAPAIRCDNAGVTVRLNRIEDNLQNGMIVYGEALVQIQENTFARNVGYAGAGLLLYHAVADVSNNIFEANHGYIGGACCTIGGSGSSITGNLFRANHATAGGGGIYLIEEGAISITGNLFVADTSDHGGGIAVSGRDSVSIANNTFDLCIGGIGSGGGNAMWWAHDSDVACSFKNNIVTNCSSLNGLGGAVGGDQQVVGFIDLGYNAFMGNAPVDFYRFAPGPVTLYVDPQFCNPPAGDYHLNPGSPCLGSGEGGVDRGAFGVGCAP